MALIAWLGLQLSLVWLGLACASQAPGDVAANMSAGGGGESSISHGVSSAGAGDTAADRPMHSGGVSGAAAQATGGAAAATGAANAAAGNAAAAAGSGGLSGNGGMLGSALGQAGAAGDNAGSAMLAGASAAGAGAAAAGGDPAAGDVVDAAALAKAMGFGANIGNTLENTSSWETGWGQPMISKAFIDGMASHGIKTVRVPVAWDTYAKDGVIAADKLSRVKEVVNWISAAGMYAIVDIHWDGGWIFNENKANAYRLTDDVKTKFESYWEQIASGFSDVGHKLILEALNEEARFYVNGDQNGTPDIAALNQINQLFVTTVRAQGGYNSTRALLVVGFNTDINKTCVDAFTVPTDPAGAGKLFLSIHYYDPYTFTLMEDQADWGSPSATWGTDAEKKALEDQFTKLGTFSDHKQIPVIIGEFAVIRGMKVMRQPASRILWMESVAKAALSRGMVPVLWDTGSEISRSDGSLSSELQTVLSHLN